MKMKNKIIIFSSVFLLLLSGIISFFVVSSNNKKKENADTLSVSGIFIAVGIIPNTKLIEGLVELDEKGYVVAGEDCRTSRNGIFAAGDVRKKALRQIITAVADGANAITSVERYLLQ